MLDLAHVGRLRVAIEELPHRLLAGVVTGLGRSLARNRRGRGAARDDRASGPPAHAGSWALPSLLLHTKRRLLDWCVSGPGKPGATHYCKEKGAPRHPQHSRSRRILMERCNVNQQPNLRSSAFGFWRWIRTRKALSASR